MIMLQADMRKREEKLMHMQDEGKFVPECVVLMKNLEKKIAIYAREKENPEKEIQKENGGKLEIYTF